MMTKFNSKQKIAILLSPILFVVMFAVYQGFAAILGSNIGWYAGFAIYWPLFCVAIPFLLVGSGRIIERYKMIKIDPKGAGPRQAAATGFPQVTFGLPAGRHCASGPEGAGGCGDRLCRRL